MSNMRLNRPYFAQRFVAEADQCVSEANMLGTIYFRSKVWLGRLFSNVPESQMSAITLDRPCDFMSLPKKMKPPGNRELAASHVTISTAGCQTAGRRIVRRIAGN